MKQKYKIMPGGGYGIDWSGSYMYADTLDKAKDKGLKFLTSQDGRDVRTKATHCAIAHRKPGTEGKFSQWRDVAKILPSGGMTIVGQQFNPLPEIERLQLVKSVAQSVFDNFESFREQNIGADLAYLIIAIIAETWEFVDWTRDCYEGWCELLSAIGKLYPDRRHSVWLYIQAD